MRLLILGSNGLVGNTITKYFFGREDYQTIGILKNYSKIKLFNEKYHKNFLVIENILDFNETRKNRETHPNNYWPASTFRVSNATSNRSEKGVYSISGVNSFFVLIFVYFSYLILVNISKSDTISTDSNQMATATFLIKLSILSGILLFSASYVIDSIDLVDNKWGPAFIAILFLAVYMYVFNVQTIRVGVSYAPFKKAIATGVMLSLVGATIYFETQTDVSIGDMSNYLLSLLSITPTYDYALSDPDTYNNESRMALSNLTNQSNKTKTIESVQNAWDSILSCKTGYRSTASMMLGTYQYSISF